MIQEGSWQETLSLAAKLTQTLTHQALKSFGDLQEAQQPLSFLGQRVWLAALTGLVLFSINGRLLLAVVAGLGSLKLLNWLNQKHWLPAEALFQRGLIPGAPPLTLPPILVAGGSTIAALGAYIAASILMEADSFWIAAGGILQGLITVAILCLLIWRMGDTPNPQPSSLFDLEQQLTNLTHTDPLKRLIAVRQITRLASQAEPEQIYLADAQLSLRSHLTDCFRLMLRQEPDAIVRAAVRESLQLVSPKPQLPKGAQPLASTIAVKRSAHHRHRHQVDYVEP